MTQSRYHPALHTIALLTVCATFPLIFMGGLVTSHQAGMSVPDWPNSYGYNMFLFPPKLWIGGILYEHTHRLMGSVVGMLSIALAIAAWKVESRRHVRYLAYTVLAAVIFQGILGGLRVVVVKLDLAVIHACFAQAFFCLAASVTVMTSRWWIQRGTGFQSVQSDDARGLETRATSSIFRLAVIACTIIYLQLIAGALMRHYQAGLAIPDFPASYGRILPPTTAADLEFANAERTFNLNLERVTLPQIWLHFTHRIGALLVTLSTLALTWSVLRHRSRDLALYAIVLILLLIAQITLGILTVLWRKPADIATFHVATGALTLVTTFILTLKAARIQRGTGASPVSSRSMHYQESRAGRPCHEVAFG